MFGKRNLKRISLIVSFFIVSPQEINYSANLRSKIKQLESTRQKLLEGVSEKKNEIFKQKNIQYNLSQSISGLEIEITLLINSIRQLEDENESYDLKIKDLEQQKEEKERFISEKKELLAKCFRLIYMHKIPSVYELLFQACDFDDFIDRSRISKLVFDEFFRIADIIMKEKSEIDRSLKEIDDLKSTIQKKLIEIDDNKKKLETKKINLEKLYTDSKKSEIRTQHEIDFDDAEMRRVDREVENYKRILLEQSKKNTAPTQSSRRSYKQFHSEPIPTVISGTLLWPVRGCNRITSGFYDKEGRNHQHNALDITASRPGAIMGEPILAPANMRVTYAGWCGGYGNHVRGEFILNGESYEVRFGHLCSINVSTGQYVNAGNVIGNVGNTGHSTGPHLHFEIRKNSVPINPESFSYSGR